MQRFPAHVLRVVAVLAHAFLLSPAATTPARAQSNDLSYPTPIFSNEVAGRIAPRDIGDPRRTRHFYTFRGTEGDIVVTLESSELSGDVDLFTAGTLRPLLKITLYGGPTAATRSVFLRRDETLVLRVEARAAGEAEGAYRIRLGGSFAPAPAGLAESPAPAAPELPDVGQRGRGVRRVTSTGARIEEPAPPPEEARAEPSPTPAEARAEQPAARREAPRSSRRGRGSASTNRRRGRAPSPAPAEAAGQGETTDRSAEAAATNPAAGNPPAEAGSGETAAAPETARAPRRSRPRTPRRTAPRERPESGAAAGGGQPTGTAPEPEAPGRRLVIVTKDGETIERDMRTVRRVTVENNQVVVVTRDGKTTRHPLSNVARMAIEQ